jgi:charged multivesicular body protein 3
MDRQIRNISMEEEKIKRTMKASAKKGDMKTCKTLAKEIVRSRKATERIYISKAQLNSVALQLTQQAAQLKVAGALKKSTEIMKTVNQLVKIPELHQQMEQMASEMMKAGIMDEMMEDAMDALDEEEVEEEAEEEVNKVLFELTDGILGQANKVNVEKLEESDQLNDKDEELEKRLKALAS